MRRRRSPRRRRAASSPCMERASSRSEEHTSELQSLRQLVCRLLLEKKKETDGTGAAGEAAVPERALSGAAGAKEDPTKGFAAVNRGDTVNGNAAATEMSRSAADVTK